MKFKLFLISSLLTGFGLNITAADVDIRRGGGSGVGGNATNAQPPSIILTNISATGAITNLVIPNTLFVSGSGNDSSGARTRMDKPFLTITAAKNAASAGDLIYIFAGTYLATNIISKNGVNYYGGSDVTLTNLPVTTAPAIHDAINDLSGATTNFIYGSMQYKFLWETNQTSFSSLGFINITNPASYVIVNGSRMQGRHFSFSGANGSPAVRVVNCRLFVLNLDEYYDPDIDRVSFDPLDPETEIKSDCTFVHWSDGEIHVNVKRASTENGYVVWSSGATNDLYYRGDYIASITGNAVYSDATSGNNRTWIELSGDIDSGGAAISTASGATKVYIRCSKIKGGASDRSAIFIAPGTELWINAQKLTASTTGNPAFGAFMDITGGKNFMEIMHYETLNPLDGPGFLIKGGVTEFIGGEIDVTNNIGFMFTTAPSTNIFINTTIRTYSSVGSGNTNECLMQHTNANIGVRGSLSMLAPAGVNSIKSTNADHHIKLFSGIVSANTPFGANVTVTNYGVIITNVSNGLVLTVTNNGVFVAMPGGSGGGGDITGNTPYTNSGATVYGTNGNLQMLFPNGNTTYTFTEFPVDGQTIETWIYNYTNGIISFGAGGANVTNWQDKVLPSIPSNYVTKVWVTKAGSVTNYSLHGPRLGAYRTVFIPAGAMISNITEGATLKLEEYGDAKINDYYEFSGIISNSVQVVFPLPVEWNLGTVKIKPYWSSTNDTANQTVVWEFAAGAVSDGDSMDSAFGTIQLSQDDVTAGQDMMLGPATPALTIGNSPAAEDLIWWRVRRLPGHASDDCAGVVKLLGIWVQYQENAFDPASW